MNLKLKLSFGLGEKGNWNVNPDKAIETIKATYYSLKKKELEDELNEKESIVKDFNPNDVYEKCLTTLRSKVANKYSKKAERTQFKDGKKIYFNPASFASEYPVILSTTFSSRGTIGQGTEFLFDYVIMDEASQVDVVTGALALSCAKNAVIVGDKMQLPNVIEEQKKKIIQVLKIYLCLLKNKKRKLYKNSLNKLNYLQDIITLTVFLLLLNKSFLIHHKLYFANITAVIQKSSISVISSFMAAGF